MGGTDSKHHRGVAQMPALQHAAAQQVRRMEGIRHFIHPQNFLERAKPAAPSAPASPPIGAAIPPAAPSIVPTAVPSNYRQLIASKLGASVDLKRLIKAEISLPGEGWMGLINGGNRPMACVTLTIKAPLIPQTQTTGYTFKNGQIDDVFSIDAYPGGAVRAVIASALFAPLSNSIARNFCSGS